MTDCFARFGWPDCFTPMAIAHRGASDHAPENTEAAFRLAHELGAEMWEIDVRMSADGVAMVCHDADLARIAGRDLAVAGATAEELRAVELPGGGRLMTLAEAIALARDLGAGLYVELKDPRAGPAVWEALRAAGFRFAAIAAFEPGWIAELREAGCDWPLAVLVPQGADPLAHAAPARPDIVHLCWLGADPRPDRLLTGDLVGDIRATGAEIVTWHEDRPEVIAGLRARPILGICSNRPEVLKPKLGRTEVVCHRGACTLAPENTLEAARIALDQGFEWVELDVRTTADGELVAIHDATLDRTTDGRGAVAEATLAEIADLDAGAWFSPLHAGLRVPTLRQMLRLAHGRGGRLYVEIKDAAPDRVLEEIEAEGMAEAVFLWCHDFDALRWLRARRPALLLMAARWAYGSVAGAIADYGAQIVEFDVTRDDLAEMAVAQDLGARAMIYSLTDDPAELTRYADLGADMVNLDHPGRFKLITDYGRRGA